MATYARLKHRFKIFLKFFAFPQTKRIRTWSKDLKIKKGRHSSDSLFRLAKAL